MTNRVPDWRSNWQKKRVNLFPHNYKMHTSNKQFILGNGTSDKHSYYFYGLFFHFNGLFAILIVFFHYCSFFSKFFYSNADDIFPLNVTQKQNNTTQYNITQHSTRKQNTKQNNLIQHNTTHHNTTQHNIKQHNTT